MKTNFGPGILRAAIFALAIQFAAPAHAELQGDDEAIALANEMMEAMGGRDVWAAANWMYAKERSLSVNHKLPLDYQGWRGLKTPQGSYQVESSEISYKQVWTLEGGWRVLNGEYAEFDAERLAGEVNFWPREIYTMYHRFAAGDASLRLIYEEGRKFRVEDAQTAAPLGVFTTSLEGGPVVWSSGDTDDDVTYVYGPLKSFGPIKLPAWGAQTGGDWRFTYVDAKLHNDAPPADMFTPRKPSE